MNSPGREPLPSRIKKFFLSWIIYTLAVLIAAQLVKGIRSQSPLDLAAAALVLGILNALLRPILIRLAFPLLVLTLGVFLLVINGMLLYFVGFLLRPHFYVTDFWSAFWGALIISFVVLVLNTLTGTGTSRIRFRHHQRPAGRDDVIDI